MRMPTFNKLGSVCLYCHKNKVAVWNKRCDECKQKKVDKKKSEVYLGKRIPAAVMTDAAGNEVFVDKTGNVTRNPGYDFANDPRGWKYAGKVKKKTII